MRIGAIIVIASCASLIASSAARAGSTFNFSTGDPDGKIATLTRPPTPVTIETETADDFILTNATRLDSATFTGILTDKATTANIGRVTVDIYRVFPKDSDATRTINVPTRTNSPGDVETDGRDTANSNMTFTTTVVNASFAAANSVVNGIHALPNQTTGGEGPVSGQEVQLNVVFSTPLNLPADHYFFRPEVEVTGGSFLWLSAAKPIVAPGTTFSPDLQSWIRNETIAPDWGRVGADVVGAPAGTAAPAFNASFSLSGEQTQPIPLPAAAGPGLGLLSVLIAARWFSRSKQAA